MNSSSNFENRIPLERRGSVREKGNNDELSAPTPFSEYKDVPAWVLIGDPGAGKTDVFESLSRAEGGYCTNARDFLALDLPEHRAPLLFIDGLDEISGGGSNGQTVIDRIRNKLQLLGTPRFRISCREAEWRGSADSAALQRLVPEKEFLELHLAPLEKEQIVALLRHWLGDNDAAAYRFISEARNRGLQDLLGNPLHLHILFKAVGGNTSNWPEGRTRTYDLACVELLGERNSEHLANLNNTAVNYSDLMAAAEYLCAILLLSGSSVIETKSRAESRPGVVQLVELTEHSAALQTVLGRGLFKGDGHGDFMSVHRTIAEFLGARHLSSLISKGLPLNRILALMLGWDGGVVPELRGLYAWLATLLPPQERLRLIERDPLGIVLYGDAGNISKEDKTSLINALKTEATEYTFFRHQHWQRHPFGALASTDMEDIFQQWLQSPERDPAHMAVIDCLMDALLNGQPMPGLIQEIEGIVRDSSFWPGIRKEALRLLTNYALHDEQWSGLTKLLDDVQSGAIKDPDDELLGLLLDALYPGQLSPQKLFAYFRKAKNERLLGSFWNFWTRLATDKVPDDDLPTLLDHLAASGYQLEKTYDHLRTSRLIGQLLTKAIHLYGLNIETIRLYQWLSLGLGKHGNCYLDAKHKQTIRQWIEHNPAIYKELLSHGLEVNGLTGFPLYFAAQSRLFGANTPDDADTWILELAKMFNDTGIRCKLVMEVFNLIEGKRGVNAALEMLEAWSKTSVEDRIWIERFITEPYPPPPTVLDELDYNKSSIEQDAEESRHRLKFISDAIPSLKTKNPNLALLVNLANEYLGLFSEFPGETPSDRIYAFLGKNQEWLELALSGLRNCLHSDALPTLQQIIQLNRKGQHFNIALPCLAAIQLRYEEDTNTAFELPEGVLETVFAFQLLSYSETEPVWLHAMMAKQHPVVCRVLQLSINSQIRAKRQHPDGLYALAYDPEYKAITKAIVPNLIAEFPLKSAQKQLYALQQLLAAMLNSLDRKTQSRIVQEKLDQDGMSVAQHVYWRVAGALVEPDKHLEETRQYVRLNQARTAHAIGLIRELHERDSLPMDLSIETSKFLIELLAPKASTGHPVGVHWVTTEMTLGRYVDSLIRKLSASPEVKAGKVLESLYVHRDLRHWHGNLERALFEHRLARRKASFRPASVPAVCATLSNQKPSNAADLWALTVDHLEQLGHNIEHGDTNECRQFWAGSNPKVENDCRDTLLSKFRYKLSPLGVTAEREGSYAEDTRADIKVIAHPYHIPIEIKRETHFDLWTGITEQLIRRYLREEATDGYGIYLVFWFGLKERAVPLDGGTKPITPSELQQRLQNIVLDEYRYKIAVLVIDCSRGVTKAI